MLDYCSYIFHYEIDINLGITYNNYSFNNDRRLKQIIKSVIFYVFKFIINFSR